MADRIDWSDDADIVFAATIGQALLVAVGARARCLLQHSQPSDVWHRSGLRLDEPFQQKLDEATLEFISASSKYEDLDAHAGHAIHALNLLHHAAEELSESYASQAIAFRKTHEAKLNTLLGATLFTEAGEPQRSVDYAQAFNTAAVRISWGEIETDAGRYDFDRLDDTISWSSALGLRVIVDR